MFTCLWVCEVYLVLFEKCLKLFELFMERSDFGSLIFVLKNLLIIDGQSPFMDRT